MLKSEWTGVLYGLAWREKMIELQKNKKGSRVIWSGETSKGAKIPFLAFLRKRKEYDDFMNGQAPGL